MADDYADETVIEREGSFTVKEGRLEDTSGNGYVKEDPIS